MSILIIEFQDEPGQIIILVECGHQCFSHERQLEIKKIGMTGLEIFDECRDGKAVGIVIISIAIDSKIHHSQEGIGVYILVLAHISHRFVAETQADAESTQRLKYAIIVPNEQNHLVIRFIHFMIFHTFITYL